jgi:uncharacterized SAM-binding protein YcdF (DUF218 family)
MKQSRVRLALKGVEFIITFCLGVLRIMYAPQLSKTTVIIVWLEGIKKRFIVTFLNWDRLPTSFKHSKEVRQLIYTINPIEGFHPALAGRS